ncbi:alpha/beta fold hydrolase [Salinimicrobium sp. GXAS 041]|uniref:alpha/beta fold hydrolase n=1 Tax=Salinimicrobium sp. GXAS 041 TaxID=3400806 RepID=UPI003C72F4E7
MTTTYKGAEIFFTTRGSGNPLILLHGFLESGKVWEEFIQEYEKERQIVTIDLPGHGKSGCFDEVHSMEEMAEAVHQVLSTLNIQKADFAGHSMGGYVALAYLEKYPEEINKLILLNSTPAADSEEKKQNRERSISVVKKNKAAFVSMAISNLLSPENSEKFRNELSIMKKEAEEFPLQGIIAALEGMKIRTSRIDVLKNFIGDKYILTGEKDPILPYQDIKKLAEETECSLFTFPDGHLLPIENKDEFLQIMLFIE